MLIMNPTMKQKRNQNQPSGKEAVVKGCRNRQSGGVMGKQVVSTGIMTELLVDMGCWEVAVVVPVQASTTGSEQVSVDDQQSSCSSQ